MPFTPAQSSHNGPFIHLIYVFIPLIMLLFMLWGPSCSRSPLVITTPQISLSHHQIYPPGQAELKELTRWHSTGHIVTNMTGMNADR